MIGAALAIAGPEIAAAATIYGAAGLIASVASGNFSIDTSAEGIGELVGNVVGGIVGGGIIAGGEGGAASGGGKFAELPSCFPPGTLVLMADGTTKAIQEINEGDEVWASDPNTGYLAGPHKVLEVHRNWTNRLIDAVLDPRADGKPIADIAATGEHPFWTTNRGWVSAKDLAHGDVLARVTSVKVVYERVIRVDYAALFFTSDFVSMTSSRFSMVM